MLVEGPENVSAISNEATVLLIDHWSDNRPQEAPTTSDQAHAHNELRCIQVKKAVSCPGATRRNPLEPSSGARAEWQLPLRPSRGLVVAGKKAVACQEPVAGVREPALPRGAPKATDEDPMLDVVLLNHLVTIAIPCSAR